MIARIASIPPQEEDRQCSVPFLRMRLGSIYIYSIVIPIDISIHGSDSNH